MSHKYRCDYTKCSHTGGPENWFNTVVYHLLFTGYDEPPQRSPTGAKHFHWECLKKYVTEDA